jgi:hypothetical protein
MSYLQLYGNWKYLNIWAGESENISHFTSADCMATESTLTSEHISMTGRSENISQFTSAETQSQQRSDHISRHV